MLMGLDGSSMGSLLDDPELVERLRPEVGPVLRENRTRVLQIQKEGKPVSILLEPIRPEPTVFIFGCGHISTCLAPLAKTVGFHVVVTDDRPMFANRERFPEADEIVVAPFTEVFNRLKIDESAYLVIVTRGHLYDGAVLEQALQTSPRYIGMIGSQKKIGTLYANLMKRGISRDLLRGVHAPIGLDIGAETPEEIAISIVAELIQVRAEGDLDPPPMGRPCSANPRARRKA
jgi:xanthine dehydrogenase accessory factor